MSSTAYGHAGPVTEEEYLSLGETPERVELFDGRIEVSPLHTPLHSEVSFWLKSMLNAPLDSGCSSRSTSASNPVAFRDRTSS
jgi:Uma2 family endonuclease